MRIIRVFVTLVALVFGFVAIAFVTLFSFLAILFRPLFGRPRVAPGPAQSAAGSAPRTTHFNGDDVIDVVTTPVAKD